MPLSSLLGVSGGWPLVLLVGLVVYCVYKRYEPATVASAVFLLFVIPALLVIFQYNHATLRRTILDVYALYWTAIGSCTVAYRLSPFHPLARYPGPLICKISKWWFVYIVMHHKTAHLYMQKLHVQYGEIVRIGPNEISITSRDAVAAVMGPKGLPRGPYYDTRAHDTGISIDGLRDPVLHASRRKTWNTGMGSTALKYYEGLVGDTVNALLRAFHDRDGKQLDMSEWMTFFGYDVMGRISFTYDFGMLERGHDSSGMTRLVEGALRDLAWIAHVPWSLPFLKHIPGAGKTAKEMQVVGEKMVKERMQTGRDDPDLFYHLMSKSNLEDGEATLELAAIDGGAAIVAGSDTVATTLAHLWYFLFKNPDCFTRLREEIDENVPREYDTAHEPARQGTLLYLNACINETLRLYPPVLSSLQRRVERRTGGKTVGLYFIPEETQVSVCAYAIHRDSRYYSPMPDTFWPDRWISQETFVLPSGDAIPKEQVKTDRDMFMPFSMGPMVCVGRNVAIMEIRAVVCAVMQQFDLEIADKACWDVWEDSLRETFVTHRRGTLPVFIKTRAS